MTRLAHPRFGLDYTDASVSVATHHHYESSFACRYLSRYGWKVLTREEAARLRDGRIDLAVVFEDGADNARHGHGQGVADAQYALAHARWCGMPEHRPIYFAVDYDTAGNAGETDGYFDGIATVLGGFCGPYGGYEVVRRQLDRGHRFAWQTYAWSGGQLDARAQLYQFSNDHGPFDYDHAYQADFGQWGWVPQSPAPPPRDYSRFTGAYPDRHGHLLDERATVEEWDRLDRKRHPARARQLRSELTFLRDRIAYESARTDPQYWRGWRFTEIDRRLTGR